MFNSSVKSSKLATYFIPMIPSSPLFPDALQAAQKPLSQISFGIQLSSFLTKCKNTKILKVNGKVFYLKLDI